MGWMDGGVLPASRHDGGYEMDTYIHDLILLLLLLLLLFVSCVCVYVYVCARTSLHRIFRHFLIYRNSESGYTWRCNNGKIRNHQSREEMKGEKRKEVVNLSPPGRVGVLFGGMFPLYRLFPFHLTRNLFSRRRAGTMMPFLCPRGDQGRYINGGKKKPPETTYH